MSDKKLELKQLAELSAEFLKTDYGQWIIPKLAELYNDLHHAAEITETFEAKAMKVERAAGLRIAMDLLTHDAALLESGYFDEGKPAEQ